MMYNDAIADFETHLTDSRLTKNTIEAYMRDVTSFLAYISPKKSLKEIDISDLNAYFDTELAAYANSSKNRILVSIRYFFKFLESEQGIPNPAATMAKFKEGKKLPNTLSKEEMATLLDGTPDNPKGIFDAAIFELIYGSGLRASEVCAIKMNDLSLDERRVTIHGKGDKERILPLSDMSVKRIYEYLPIRDVWNKKKLQYLFVNKQGNTLNREYIHTHLKRLLKENDLPKKFSTHSLRHSFATHLMNEGVDVRIVQSLLGHEDISTTQIYTELDTHTKREEYDRCFPRK